MERQKSSIVKADNVPTRGEKGACATLRLAGKLLAFLFLFFLFFVSTPLHFCIALFCSFPNPTFGRSAIVEGFLTFKSILSLLRRSIKVPLPRFVLFGVCLFAEGLFFAKERKGGVFGGGY